MIESATCLKLQSMSARKTTAIGGNTSKTNLMMVALRMQFDAGVGKLETARTSGDRAEVTGDENTKQNHNNTSQEYSNNNKAQNGCDQMR